MAQPAPRGEAHPLQSMPLPATYPQGQSSARRLLEPLAALMPPGHASLALAGPASDHDAPADRREGFARPLLLPTTPPFWTAPEEPLAAERRDHARVILAAGLVVRGTAGAVEIITAGSPISNLMLRYGAWK
jgi:hypothetical protein